MSIMYGDPNDIHITYEFSWSLSFYYFHESNESYIPGRENKSPTDMRLHIQKKPSTFWDILTHNQLFYFYFYENTWFM